ncbi:hypothetical protein SteCoe_33556 [Stentor coeruleus]|uniref:Uncharacterized protein n=1 Tax=Stentor coeruleus TaxID=5963 RepID=A0A1R2AWG7_9CILI|nr:hypothetical protein SteCoe_33556 [Stentor coeruleus]
MKPAKVIADKVRGFKLKDTIHSYGETQTILYALGIGTSKDPMNLKELDFTYERSKNFKIMPTFGVTIDKMSNALEGLASCPGLPDFNPMMLLHGEQKLEIINPYPRSQTITIKSEFIDVADKGNGALVSLESILIDQKNIPLCKNTIRFYIRGIGEFGDKGLTKEFYPSIPKTTPDKISTDSTSLNQAILYRLAGDMNPLHISPDMAALGGFDRPILHGLCFFGFAAKAVVKEFLDYDVGKFKSISARFTSHVFPGETLITEMWSYPSGVIFKQKTIERGKICSQGYVEFNQTSN